MRPLLWMGGASLVSWILVTLVAPQPVNPELFMAMAGPLASAMASWMVTERTQRRAPERVTGVLIAGLAAKMVFFGIYVVVLVRLFGLKPVPFVIGFAAYFIALHGMEALFLKRLFGEWSRPAPGA
jgi:hypothetical protein